MPSANKQKCVHIAACPVDKQHPKAYPRQPRPTAATDSPHLAVPGISEHHHPFLYGWLRMSMLKAEKREENVDVVPVDYMHVRLTHRPLDLRSDHLARARVVSAKWVSPQLCLGCVVRLHLYSSGAA